MHPIVMLTSEDLDALVRKAAGAPEPPEVLTAEEAAHLLRLGLPCVRRWAQAGKLPAHRVGSDWRFRRSELLAWISSSAA